MSKSVGGQRQTQNSQSGVDQTTSNYLQQVMQAAQRAGQAGPSPLLTGASDLYSNYMKGGNLGFGALSGDPNAVSTLMNPYQQQVIDANNKQWGVTNANTMNAVNDAATKAGAFGGTRHGVATGTALAANNMNQQGQTAGLLSQGYGDAMNRAGQLAGMGFAGAGANANLGFGGVGSPDQWMMQQMRNGFIMPTGTRSSGSTAGTQFGASWNGGDAMKAFAGLFG